MLALLVCQQERVRLLIAARTERLDRSADRRWVGKLSVHGGELSSAEAHSSALSVAAVWRRCRLGLLLGSLPSPPAPRGCR